MKPTKICETCKQEKNISEFLVNEKLVKICRKCRTSKKTEITKGRYKQT